MSFGNKKIITGMFCVLLFCLLGISEAVAAIYDDFDDYALSQTKWMTEDEDNISTYNEGAGLVEINATAADQEFNAASLYCFSGDFDFVLRYQDWSLNSATSAMEDASPAHIGLVAMTVDSFNMMINDEDPLDFIYVMRGWDAFYEVDYYIGMGFFDGEEGGADGAVKNDTEGMLRITRTDDDFTAYYYDDAISDWYGLYSWNNEFTDDVILTAVVYSGETELLSGGFQVNMDYAAVESDGMAAVPEPATMLLMGTGCFFGMAFMRNKGRRRGKNSLTMYSV